MWIKIVEVFISYLVDPVCALSSGWNLAFIEVPIVECILGRLIHEGRLTLKALKVGLSVNILSYWNCLLLLLLLLLYNLLIWWWRVLSSCWCWSELRLVKVLKLLHSVVKRWLNWGILRICLLGKLESLASLRLDI